MARHARRRVTLPDLVYSQPFEFCISISLLIMGVRSFVGHASLSAIVGHSVANLLMNIWITTVIMGTLSILASFLLSRLAESKGLGHVSRNRTLERSGLVLLGTSAATFSAAVIAATGAAGLYTLAVMSGVIFACILRMIALRREDLGTLVRLRVIRERLDYSQDEG